MEDCSTSNNTSSRSISLKSTTTRSVSTHRRWTEKECHTVLEAFSETVKTGKMPTGEQIQKLINENACLKGREVAQLRTWLHGKKKKICERDD